MIDVTRRKTAHGEFVILPHAIQRKYQRSISASDIIHVLTTGWHESKKDKWIDEYSAWNYSIRGKSIDDRPLRIIVSFDETRMMIITVIRMDKR